MDIIMYLCSGHCSIILGSDTYPASYCPNAYRFHATTPPASLEISETEWILTYSSQMLVFIIWFFSSWRRRESIFRSLVYIFILSYPWETLLWHLLRCIQTRWISGPFRANNQASLNTPLKSNTEPLWSAAQWLWAVEQLDHVMMKACHNSKLG